ncbi:DUF4430 domain-containing protein [Bacillus tianshenii]|nr:DUF4430 domain-containing protein [Bacillus tianshenii]
MLSKMNYEKVRHYFYILLLVLVALNPFIAGVNGSKTFAEMNQTTSNYAASITVYGEANNLIIDQEIEINEEGITAFDLLKQVSEEQNIELTYSESDQYGAFITSIGGITPTDNAYWGFEVNGKAAEVGVSSYEVKANDELSFKIIQAKPYASLAIIGENEESVLAQTWLEVSEGATAFDLLKQVSEEQNIELTYSESDQYGAFITSIGGVTPTDNAYWGFEVNGKAAEVGVSSYEVKANDELSFKIIQAKPYASLAIIGESGESVLAQTWLEVSEGATAFDLLKQVSEEQNIELTYSESDQYGAFITSIGGVTPTENAYWGFEVNGKAAEVGVSSYEVQANDELSFKIIQAKPYASLAIIGESGESVLAQTWLEVSEGATAFDLLKQVSEEQNIELTYSESDQYGAFITSIGGVTPTENAYWGFEVNGKAAEVGVSSYEVKANDELLLKYIIAADYPDEGEEDESDSLGELSSSNTEYDNENIERFNTLMNEVRDSIAKDGIQSDWEAISLAQAGNQVLHSYYEEAINKIQDVDDLGQATNYARLILLSVAAGENPENINGRNYVSELAAREDLTRYINNATYSLIAFDSGDYTVDSSVKEQLVQAILSVQNSDGGWSWSGKISDPDMTAMTITALAPYYETDQVKEAVNKAISWLSNVQQADGGFTVENGDPGATVAQVIIGIASVGYSPSSKAFTKSEGNLVDYLALIADEMKTDSSMLGYQGLQALTAYQHFTHNKERIYRFTMIDPSDKGGNPSSPKEDEQDSDDTPDEVPSDDEIEVRISVKGYKSKTLLATTTVKLSGKATPYSALREAIGGSSIKTNGSGSNIYVVEIKGLAEFDYGPKSGWNYSVNGDYPSKSAGAYQLEDGDRVVWKYTADYDDDSDLPETSKDASEAGALPNNRSKLEKDFETIALPYNNQQPIDKVMKSTKVIDERNKMSLSEAKEIKEVVQKNMVNVSKKVGSNESSNIKGEHGEASIFIPQGAVKKEVHIQIQEEVHSKNENSELISSIYKFGPNGATFKKPVQISIQIPVELDRLEDYVMAWLNEETGEWIPIPAVLDANSGWITGQVDHFTQFAVLNRSIIQQKMLESHIDQTVQFVMKSTDLSQWQAFAVARSGNVIPNRNLQRIEELVKSEQGEFRKVTDYERIILSVKALGGDPTKVAGYNFIEKVVNHPRMTSQGVNGLIFGLLALDSGDYSISSDVDWTREKLIKEILNHQHVSGGFGLTIDEEPNVDLTAMALAALAPYHEQTEVKAAIEKAVDWLAKQQASNGGFRLEGKENSESVAQVMIALTSLGINPLDERFVKESGNLMTNLLSFQTSDKGFSNHRGEASNQIATEQALMALVAYQRYLENKSPLYVFDEQGPERSFAFRYKDEQHISNYAYQAVYQAKAHHFMEGVSEEQARFAPHETLTRAQFAKVLIHLLGEQPENTGRSTYEDVKQGTWYEGYVNRANQLGIVKGISEKQFAPHKPITREQMAIMIGRAVDLQATDANLSFEDVNKISKEAVPYVQALYAASILEGYGNKFFPQELVTREMAAVVSVRLFEMK